MENQIENNQNNIAPVPLSEAQAQGPTTPPIPVAPAATQAESTEPASPQIAAAPALSTQPVSEAAVKVVGVRFKRAGRIYSFDPKDMDPNLGDHVIVETARGLEVGRVVIPAVSVPASQVEMPLRAVVRMATPQEINHSQEVEKKEQDALAECAKSVTRLGLPMKLLSAEYALEGNHVTIFFSAAERVDFRELVRELAQKFRVRVELRQVGARDEAKIVGGYGRCGRQLCCCAWLSEFQPISIKMAKEQGLPLNPMKISGVCGRLLCCLSYEHKFYHDMRGKLPREGQPVSTPNGPARVVSSNPLKGTVVVELESQVTVELPVESVKLVGAPVPERREPNGDKESDELPAP
jgi:cell fate regulator YaaT (PSP1 superfamily)